MAYVETEQEALRKSRYGRPPSSVSSEDDEEESYDERPDPGDYTRRGHRVDEVRQSSDCDCPSPSLSPEDDEERYDERRNLLSFDRRGKPMRSYMGTDGAQTRHRHGHCNNNAVYSRRTSRSFKDDEERYDERPKAVSFDRGRKRHKTRPQREVVDGQIRRRHRNTDTFRSTGYDRTPTSMASKADLERSHALSRDKGVHLSHIRSQPETVGNHTRHGHRSDRTGCASICLLAPPSAPNSDDNTDTAKRNVRSVLGYTNHTVTYDCPVQQSGDPASPTRPRRNSSPECHRQLVEDSSNEDKHRRGRSAERQRNTSGAEPDGVPDLTGRLSAFRQYRKDDRADTCEYQNHVETASGNSLQKHNSKPSHQSGQKLDPGSSNDRHRGDDRRPAAQCAVANIEQAYYCRYDCGDEDTSVDRRSRRHRRHSPTPASVRSLSPTPRRQHHQRPANRHPSSGRLSDDDDIQVRSPRHAVANNGKTDNNSQGRSRVLISVDPRRNRQRPISPGVPSVRSLSPLPRRRSNQRPRHASAATKHPADGNLSEDDFMHARGPHHVVANMCNADCSRYSRGVEHTTVDSRGHSHRHDLPTAGSSLSPACRRRSRRRQSGGYTSNTSEDDYRTCRTSIVVSASDSVDNPTSSTLLTDDERSIGFPQRRIFKARQVGLHQNDNLCAGYIVHEHIGKAHVRWSVG